MKNNNEGYDFKKLFNLNTILSTIISFSAYIVLVGSIVVLTYLSFVKRLDIQVDMMTLGVFSAATILLSFVCWNMFYRKQYEKIMCEDIDQQEHNKYSIHARYYLAIKDWNDADLQIAIDNFNDEYIKKWLRYVEKTTGKPIETKKEVQLDDKGNEVLDENGKPIIITTYGIKELPYKGFKHKILMWRIKNHKYPQSGYKTSMELSSLFSFQESNVNKRDLYGDKKYFNRIAMQRMLITIMIITSGGALIPEFIDGEFGSAILKLLLSIGTLIASVISGALSGIRGARLKLSIVEDVCFDLEKWSGKKPVLAPYKEPVAVENNIVKTEIDNDEKIEESKEELQVKAIENIFK